MHFFSTLRFGDVSSWTCVRPKLGYTRSFFSTFYLVVDSKSGFLVNLSGLHSWWITHPQFTFHTGFYLYLRDLQFSSNACRMEFVFFKEKWTSNHFSGYSLNSEHMRFKFLHNVNKNKHCCRNCKYKID